MTPDLMALLSVESLDPLERQMVQVLGDADPGMLTLQEIAALTRRPRSSYGSAAAGLRARAMVTSERVAPLVPGNRPTPAYRLLPRGQAAYRQLEQQATWRAHDDQRMQRRARHALAGGAA